MIFDMMDDPTVRDALLREREDPMSGLSKLASQHWIELYTVTCEMAAVLSRFPDRQETVLRFLLGQGTGHAKLPVQPDELTNLETEIRVLEDKIARAVDAVNMADAWARASQLVRTTTPKALLFKQSAVQKARGLHGHVRACLRGSRYDWEGGYAPIDFSWEEPEKKEPEPEPEKKSLSQSPRKRQRRKKRRRKRPRRKRPRRKRRRRKRPRRKRRRRKKRRRKRPRRKRPRRKGVNDGRCDPDKGQDQDEKATEKVASDDADDWFF